MKKVIKKVFIGFSLIEVVIAVNLLALILAILGLSALGSQKLLLNAQIRSEISKIGEGILDYVCSFPPTDKFADPTISREDPNNNIYSISDFVAGNQINVINSRFIIYNANDILSRGANILRIGLANTINDPLNNNFTHKGRVIRFGTNQLLNSYIGVSRISNGIYQVHVVILYQNNPRDLQRFREIRISRIVAF